MMADSFPEHHIRHSRDRFSPLGSPEQNFVAVRRNLKPNPRRIPPSSNYEIQLFLNFNSPRDRRLNGALL